jgi:hypothetical protein
MCPDRARERKPIVSCGLAVGYPKTKAYVSTTGGICNYDGIARVPASSLGVPRTSSQDFECRLGYVWLFMRPIFFSPMLLLRETSL